MEAWLYAAAGRCVNTYHNGDECNTGGSSIFLESTIENYDLEASYILITTCGPLGTPHRHQSQSMNTNNPLGIKCPEYFKEKTKKIQIARRIAQLLHFHREI